MTFVYVVGTADTKGAELAWLADSVRRAGGDPRTVDLGTRTATVGTDITAAAVAAHHPDGPAAVLGLDDRGTAVAAMAEAFARFIVTRDDVAAIVGIGGGGGTSMITAGMRALPFGVPKLMVSTLASGDVSSYVGVSDIVMMPAVADIAGLNRITRSVLARAAEAVVGMTRPPAQTDARPALGLTMFGVTTPCVTRLVATLSPDYDCLVFHATGTGGRTLEALADAGALTGVLDVTTTEVADHLVGGVLSAGPDRLGAIARSRVPWVGSCGALDMVNFRAVDTVPDRYKGRTLYRHNPNVTLMRTTAAECVEIGAWIAHRLNACEGPVRFLIPEGGVSALDAPGQPFHDPEADAALFGALEQGLRQTADRRLRRLPLHVNDPAFADALVAAWREIAPDVALPESASCPPSPAPTS